MKMRINAYLLFYLGLVIFLALLVLVSSRVTSEVLYPTNVTREDGITTFKYKEGEIIRLMLTKEETFHRLSLMAIPKGESIVNSLTIRVHGASWIGLLTMRPLNAEIHVNSTGSEYILYLSRIKGKPGQFTTDFLLEGSGEMEIRGNLTVREGSTLKSLIFKGNLSITEP